ncbi:MAG: hypothetical protein AB7L28_06695, partial [Kofleriaceae bacterium]
MKEVSCKAFHVFLRPLEEKGVALERMVEGTSLSVAELKSRSGRLDWAELCQVHRNVRPWFSDEDLIDLGHKVFQHRSLRFMFVVARLLLTPMTFYRWMNKPRQGAGNQMFTCVTPRH